MAGHTTNLNSTLRADDELHREILQEAAIMKLTSRRRKLEIQRSGEEVPRNDIIVTLLADLQQEQDKESEILMALLADKVQHVLCVSAH